MKAYITATASFLPGAPVGNDEMEKVLGQVGERPSVARARILKSNGIKSRHYALDPATGQRTHTNAQLTAEAVRRLVTKAGVPLTQIDLLGCGTTTPDQFVPGHASMVHGELGAPPMEVVTGAGACCASMTTLKYAAMAVAAGEAQRAVVTGSEVTSTLMLGRHFEPEIEERVKALEKFPHLAFEHDFLRWMLSDGAGAFLLESEPNRRGGLRLGIEWIEYVSFAGEIEACMYHGARKREDGSLECWRDVDDIREAVRRGFFNLGQDARLLGKNIGRLMAEGLRRTLQKHPLKPEELAWFLPHYSSHFFRPEVESRLPALDLPIPEEKVFTNLTEKGNTGAGSIFIMLDELLTSGRAKPGQKVLCFVPESARFSVAYMLLTVLDE